MKHCRRFFSVAMSVPMGSGDGGETSLFSGRKVYKDDARIEAVGSLDELQSLLGMILSLDLHRFSREILENIPHLLFDISGEIAGEGKFVAVNVTPAEVEKMEEWVEFLEEKLPSLREFILPGGAREAQWLNLARAVARRAERRAASLFREGEIRPDSFRFLNRLSRLLFSLERWENFRQGGGEKKWQKGVFLPKVEELKPQDSKAKKQEASE